VKLLVRVGGQVILERPLEQRALTLGSGPDNDVVLPSAGVAGQHARLEFLGGRYHLLPVDRKATTTINGIAADGQVLAPGAVAKLGDVELTIETTPKARRPPPEDKQANLTRLLLDLLQITSGFGEPTEIREVFGQIMDGLIHAFGVERCVLLLRTDGEMKPVIARNLEPDSVSRVLSSTVLAEAQRTRRPAIHVDVASSQTLSGAESLISPGVGTVVCHPLLSGETVEGLLYLDGVQPTRVLAGEAAQALEIFARHAAVALTGNRVRQELALSVGQHRQMARDAVAQVHGSGEFVAADPKSRALLVQVRKVAATEVTALITGASGTGKELVARAIHAGSSRSGGPFIAVNCGALPRDLVESELFGHEKGAFSGAAAAKPGRFELAHRGTLFLDEIGEIPLDTQVKLLRALQERVIDRIGGVRSIPVDIRLIAATNVDLKEKVKAGSFREDLFYRVHVFGLHIPPLRERTGDITVLAHHFVREFNARMGRHLAGLSPEALEALLSYNWPGNVRELRNVLERAFVLEESDMITPESLPWSGVPGAIPAPTDVPDRLDDAVKAFERTHIVNILASSGYAIAKAARALGVSRQTLYNKLKEHGIQVEHGLKET
jgi:Nif-specific regulatory protein